MARIVVKDGRADRIVLEDGSELQARNVLSSAGWLETMRLCDQAVPAPRPAHGLSIVESISVLNRQPRALGHDRTMVFFNDSDKFHYEKPAEPPTSAAASSARPTTSSTASRLADGILRITVLANYDRWAGLDAPAYRLAETPLVRPHGRLGRALRPRFPRRRDRDRHVHARHHPAVSPATTRGPSSAPRRNATTAPRT